jgi:hypothetical protein
MSARNEWQVKNLFTGWSAPRPIRAANGELALALARKAYPRHRAGLAVITSGAPPALPAADTLTAVRAECAA